jgi:hypothetical protein
MDRLSELLPVGPPLSEAQQIGRTSAIDSLEGRLCSCHVVKMLEPRRVGKTSVARAALERIRLAGGTVADVNLAIRASPEDAASDLADQLAGGVVRARRRLGGFVSGLRRADAGEAIGEERAFALRVAAELLSGSASPAVVIERAAARVQDGVTAVLLDEAHTLARWPESARMAMGAVLKDNQALGVVVASSERRALGQLTAPEGPLRYVGARFDLPAIAHEDWQGGLRERFAELSAPITVAALGLLLEQSRGHPYCTMLLAHESGRLGMDVGEVSEAVVRAALVTVRRDEAWRELL